MAIYSILSGGGKQDVSEFLSSDKALHVFGMALLIFLIKSFIVQWSYNTIWPKITINSGGSVEKFRPLTYVEAMVLTLLAINIFKL